MISVHRRRVGAFLVGALLAALLTVVARPVTAATPDCETAASSTWPIMRLAGEDRYATAACVASVGYPDGAATVLLARGDAAGGFADALAGTPLAHAVDGPVLLTRPDALPLATRQALVDLDPDEVIVLGGTAAVSSAVETQVRSLGTTVRRVRGDDRAATAAAIADLVGGTAAYVVNGTRPADALTAGAAAARDGAALLLTDTNDLPAVTADALADRGSVTIVGGHGVVGAAAEDAVRAIVPDVRRLGGGDRFETAATVARVHPGAGTLHVVGGADANLVDAIAAGWLAAGPDGGPVVYAQHDAPGRGADRYLRLGALAGAPPTRIVGGDASLSDDLVSALEDRYEEAAAGGPPAQMRGLWVHLFDSSLKTREGIEQVLNAAAGANLNTIVVQGARRHDAFYDSDVLPPTSDPDLEAGLDVLGDLVPAAHARGLQVEVWFATMPSFHPSMADEDLGPDHVHNQHGPDTADPWMATGQEPGLDYMDPAIPGVQDHVAAMLREVVERYDVDGVNLDYTRYECLTVNDNGTCATGGPDEPASPNQHPVTMQRFADHHEAGETLADFMRAQTQDLVRRVYLEVADAAPSALVSGDLIAQGAAPPGNNHTAFEQTKAYWMKGQDWMAWLDEGIIDHAYPMDYRSAADQYAPWYEDWVDFAAATDGPDHVTAVGQAAFLNCVADSLDQIELATSRTDGVMLYSWQGDVIEDNPYRSDDVHDTRCPGDQRGDLLAALPAGPFADPAPVPAVPRKAAPTQGHVLVQAADGEHVTLTPASGPAVTRRADATGHAGFVWIDPGTVQVSVEGGPTRTVTVTPGHVTRVDLT